MFLYNPVNHLSVYLARRVIERTCCIHMQPEGVNVYRNLQEVTVQMSKVKQDEEEDGQTKVQAN